MAFIIGWRVVSKKVGTASEYVLGIQGQLLNFFELTSFKMEDANHVFPFVIHGQETSHLAESIFSHLSKKDLMKCAEVHPVWKDLAEHCMNAFPFVIKGEDTPEVAARIFGYLGREDLIKCRSVHTDWKSLADTLIWDDVQLQCRAAREGRLDIYKLIVRCQPLLHTLEVTHFVTPFVTSQYSSLLLLSSAIFF